MRLPLNNDRTISKFLIGNQMFIDIKTNLPNDGAEVMVRLDDGTLEKERYGVARYSAENGFKPTNLHIAVYGGHERAAVDFDYPVIAWKSIK